MASHRLRRSSAVLAAALLALALGVGLPGPVSAQTPPPDPTATASGACAFHERMSAVLVQITDPAGGNTFSVSVDGVVVGSISGVYLTSGDGVHRTRVDWVEGDRTILDQDVTVDCAEPATTTEVPTPAEETEETVEAAVVAAPRFTG